MTEAVRIDGACHCGNIRFVLAWPGPLHRLTIRDCGCTFCRKHGGSWTSHRRARLQAAVLDVGGVSRYRFGTATADFHVCSRCGVVPMVTSEIGGRLYAVVNANCFEGVDISALSRTQTDFDGEASSDRLERRQRNWIADVQIAEPAA